MISFSCNLSTKLNTSGVEKKELKNVPKEWEQLTETKLIKSHNAQCLLTGKINNITVIDIDDKTIYDEWVISNPDIKNYKTIKTDNVVKVIFTIILIFL